MGTINDNIADFRILAGMTQKELGEKIGRSRSTVQSYEAGTTEIPYSVVEQIAEAVGVTMTEMVSGKKTAVGKDMRIRIYAVEDRLNVAQILIRNGYTVSQGKEKKTPDGKAMIYYLRVREDEGNADTSR